MLPGTRLLTPVSRPEFRDALLSDRSHCGGRCRGSAEGVLFAYGRRAAGFTLYVQDGRLCFDYNLAGRHSVVRSPALPNGARRLAVELELRPARAQLTADGGLLCTAGLPAAFPAGFGLLSSQCGMNYPSPVSNDYHSPFRFTGALDEVVITLGEGDDPAEAGLWEAAHRSQ